MEQFDHLLERAEKLNSVVASRLNHSVSAVPRLDRSLPQVFQAGESLNQRVLASSNTNGHSDRFAMPSFRGPQFMDENLPSLREGEEYSAHPSTSQALDTDDCDLDTFLRNQRESSLISLIDESITKTFADVEKRQWELALSDWEQQKRKLFDAIPATNIDDSLPTPSKLSRFVDKSHHLGGHGHSKMSEAEISFSRAMNLYAEQIVSESFNGKMIDGLAEEASKLKVAEFDTIWNEVRSTISNLNVQMNIDLATQRVSSKFKLQFLDNAIRVLQELYLQHVEMLVYGNLGEAELGGVPGNYHLVHAYLNVRMPVPYPTAEDGLLEGHPVWAVIYYCLRIGHFEAALHAAEAAGPVLSDFLSILVEMANKNTHRLSPDSETKLKLHYRRIVRSSMDPYKRLVYCLLCACDVEESHPEVCDKLEDWLWMKLNHARKYELSQPGDGSSQGSSPKQRKSRTQVPQDSLPLARLQKLVLEDYGESHFASSDTAQLCFSCIWLTGQFEAALDYLFRYSDAMRAHAVHMAAAVHHTGLLLLPESTQAKLLSQKSSDPPGVHRLNLARMIMMYTAGFENSDPREALHYYYFLRDFKTPSGSSLYMACMSELALRTKEYDMLLGRILPDGKREPGLVDRYQLHYNVKRLIEFVAADADRKGITETAVRLYDLAGNHAKVLELLSSLLSQIASQAPVPNSNRERISEIAFAIAKRYKNQGHTASEEVVHRFYLLIDILSFFELYHSGDFRNALDIIKQIDLIPVKPMDVEQFVSVFSMVPEQVRRILPDVLLAVMTILSTDAKELKSTRSLLGSYVSDEGPLNEIRGIAQAMVVYAGRIPYRIPGDTTARLIQLEAVIN